ncbi:MAG: hypothetical protein BroJett011_75190 [Chloroflexota bacterium]|nr:MAG: hypothetical protein BroJett011_75190 [Chloroflexota bacterium]
MSRVRVVLDEFTCEDTEDYFVQDEFYVAGAVSDGSTSVGVLTKPIPVRNGQTKQFGVGGGTVFDADVADGRILKVALVAFDEDANKDWAQHGQLVTKIGQAVSAGLAAIPNPYTAEAAKILPFAIAAVGGTMQLDRDDELGQHLREFNIGQISNGTHGQEWSFQDRIIRFWSDWKYKVRYRIIKG